MSKPASRSLTLTILLIFCILLNLLLIAECFIWRSQGENLLFGRYTLKFLVGVFFPAVALLIANIAALQFPSQIIAALGRLKKSHFFVGVITLILLAAVYSIKLANAHIALYFFITAFAEACGLLLLRLNKAFLLPMTLLGILLITPILLIESVLFHYQNRIESLPDYKTLVVDLTSKAVDLPDLRGGLLLPDKDVVARSNTRFGTIRWITNSVGFRNDKEILFEKPRDVYRIMVLGDSFSSGYRLSQKETFPFQLYKELTKQKRKVEVINVMTEDPVIGAYYMQTHGFAYHPDLVIYGLCIGNDFMENYYRLEYNRAFEILDDPNANIIFDRDRAGKADVRFQRIQFPPEYLTGKTVPPLPGDLIKPSPMNNFFLGQLIQGLRASLKADPAWTLGALRYGSLSRNNQVHPMDITSGFGFFAKGKFEEVDKAYAAAERTFQFLKQKCDRNKARLAIVAIPQGFQVYPTDWKANCDAYGLRPAQFDLERPNRWLADTCKALGIEQIDPLAVMHEKATANGRLYLGGGDMHWNAKGAALTAGVAAKAIVPFINHSQSK